MRQLFYELFFSVYLYDSCVIMGRGRKKIYFDVSNSVKIRSDVINDLRKIQDTLSDARGLSDVIQFLIKR